MRRLHDHYKKQNSFPNTLLPFGACSPVHAIHKCLYQCTLHYTSHSETILSTLKAFVPRLFALPLSFYVSVPPYVPYMSVNIWLMNTWINFVSLKIPITQIQQRMLQTLRGNVQYITGRKNYTRLYETLQGAPRWCM